MQLIINAILCREFAVIALTNKNNSFDDEWGKAGFLYLSFANCKWLCWWPYTNLSVIQYFHFSHI